MDPLEGFAVPPGQGVQVLDPSSPPYHPGRHAPHTLELLPPVTRPKKPKPQGSHFVEPARALKRPISHSRHAALLLPPLCTPYLPLGQGKQGSPCTAP